MSDIRVYSLRRLSPFQGMLEVFESPGARALSADGLNWRILVPEELPHPKWGSLEPDVLSVRYLRYGVWSKRDGLTRVPLPPLVDLERVRDAAARIVELLQAATQKPPFPSRDEFELWLLDGKDTLPLALLRSATDQAAVQDYPCVQWTPCLASDLSFVSPTLLDGTMPRNPGTPRHHRDILTKLVRETAGRPAGSQWFRRREDGSGVGLRAMPTGSELEGRVLAPEAFPELPLRERWSNSTQARLVRDFHDWQAPLLLMLPDISSSTRQRLESAACRQPLVMHSVHRLYPRIIRKDLVNKALVEAQLRKAASR